MDYNENFGDSTLLNNLSLDEDYAVFDLLDSSAAEEEEVVVGKEGAENIQILKIEYLKANTNINNTILKVNADDLLAEEHEKCEKAPALPINFLHEEAEGNNRASNKDLTTPPANNLLTSMTNLIQKENCHVMEAFPSASTSHSYRNEESTNNISPTKPLQTRSSTTSLELTTHSTNSETDKDKENANELNESYLITPTKFPTPFKNAFYFPKKNSSQLQRRM